MTCPNCSAIWDHDEIQTQECDCCGWPHIDDDENDYDPADNFGQYDEDDEEDNDPNDSRNL